MDACVRDPARPRFGSPADMAASGAARGSRIGQALKARGVRKQQALATVLNVHESAITRWKNGAAMSLENAIALCAALDISADWLLLGRGTIEAHKSRTHAPCAGATPAMAALAESISVSIETQAKLQAFVSALANDVQRRA